MDLKDVRASRQSVWQRLQVRINRCPECGRHLEREEDADIVAAWTYSNKEYAMKAVRTARYQRISRRKPRSDAAKPVGVARSGSWIDGATAATNPLSM